MTVPNTDTFTFQNVTAVVGGSDLVAAFANATDAKFDPSYKGSKNNLLNFRNYDTTRGGTSTLSISPTSHAGAGTFTVTVTASSGTTWIASASSYTSWIHITGGSGTGNGSFSVTVDAGGSLTGEIGITSAAPFVAMPITR
jgi:hypothetical protein